MDCFYFSDQELKMEEAMSHTGIHQFLYLFSGFFFNTCMGRIASFSLISIHGVPALDLLLHVWNTLTNHNLFFFSPIEAASFVVSSLHIISSFLDCNFSCSFSKDKINC